MTVNLTVRGFGLPNLCRKAGACKQYIVLPQPSDARLPRFVATLYIPPSGGQSR